MTLSLLLLYILLGAAAVMSLHYAMARDRIKQPVVSFLQHFVGVLFLVSGGIKAIDPLGTAYKMHQYFAEFDRTFDATWLSFLSGGEAGTGLLGTLDENAIGFSVFMIVLELVLGANLIIGLKPKLTSWVLFITIVFFTFLTGFTYLTGYVPEGATFFEFGSWAAWKESNMKVTDCGCFGDFLKLKPFTSFLKDIALLVPSVVFLFATDKMHRLFTPMTRYAIAGGVTLASLLFCFSNYIWDLPIVDFRPFHVEADVRNERIAQNEAMNNVEVQGFQFKNNNTGEEKFVAYDEYMSNYQAYSKEDGWEVLEQVMDELPVTDKIYEMAFEDMSGADITEDFLAYEGVMLTIVSPDLKYTKERQTVEVEEAVFVNDTIVDVDSTYIRPRPAGTKMVQTEADVTMWDASFIERFKALNPIVEAARGDNARVVAMVPFIDNASLAAFSEQVGVEYPFLKADDITLKTMIRSTPGIILWKDGKIVGKWHRSQMPSWEEMKAEKL